MKIVSVRASPGIHFHNGVDTSRVVAERLLAKYTFNSAPINIGRELARRRQGASFCEWRFWGFPDSAYQLNNIPVKMFTTTDGIDLPTLEQHIRLDGQPDVIWAEGISLTPTLTRVFELCPASLKIVYPKYSEPWLVQGLEHYHACLVDELWQIDEMASRCPGVVCRVWDKLVDYEQHFFPTGAQKAYDICYVARLHPRKYHKLLFRALARLRGPRLSVILVGSDENDCQKYLQPMADDAGVDVTFTGHLETLEVNQAINSSRIGVLCDKFDAAPRAMLEYMAADIPVLATSEMRAGVRYIGAQAGLVRSPEEFHKGIAEILEREGEFSPRQYLLANFSREQVTERFESLISSLQHMRAQHAD